MNYNSDRKDSRFKSYIDDGNFKIDLSMMHEHRRNLLDGEQLIHESQNVLMYEPICNPKKYSGICGLLTITTFKLSFTPFNGIDREMEDCCQNNSLLGPYEVCLSAIDTIYQIANNSRKKLHPCQNVSSKIKELQIICKNMRVLWFSFKNAEKDCGRQITNTLLHHVYPKRHSLLFAYDFNTSTGHATANTSSMSTRSRSENTTAGSMKIRTRTCMFRTRDDWLNELKRTHCDTNWRITEINQTFDPCPHLPQHLVVPNKTVDANLKTCMQHFRNEFIPIWTWGTKDAALVRMADLLPSILDRTQENTMLEKVREAHPRKRQPIIMDLDRELPIPRDVQQSYLRLRDLCTPLNVKEWRYQDNRFYGLLDSTRWLQYVSSCLSVARRAAEHILGLANARSDGSCTPTTVVLQEGNGQDMNCVVASLVQILLDSNTRSRYGFQTLVQKEWIVMGHPFSSRLGHVLDAGLEMAPLFLMFLDCVWQMMQQFPTAFQYSETYLTTVWDSALLSSYETFLFNSEHSRYLAERAKSSAFKSVWDWHDQFTPRDITLFNNPLYSDSRVEHLWPQTQLQHLHLWHQCYFRWMPRMEIIRGGRSHVDIPMRFIASQISSLRAQIAHNGRTSPSSSFVVKRQAVAEALNGTGISLSNWLDEVSMLEFLTKVNGFYPFSVQQTVVEHSDVDSDNGIIDNVDAQSQASS